MPALEQILKDGFEHTVRSVRRFSLRNRLDAEKRHRHRLLQRLGAESWSTERAKCSNLQAAAEIKRTEREIEELKNLEKQCRDRLLSESGTLRERVSNAEGILQDLGKECEALRETKQTLHEDIAKLQARLNEARNGLNSAGAALSESERAEAAAEAPLLEADKLKDSIANLRREAETLTGRLSKARESIIEIARRLEELAGSRRGKSQELSDLRNDLANLRKQVEDQREAEIQVLKPKLQEMENGFARLGRELLQNRFDSPNLSLIFAGLDLNASLIESLGNKIEAETTLLNLLDAGAVREFYAIAITLGTFAALLLVALLALLLARI